MDTFGTPSYSKIMLVRGCSRTSNYDYRRFEVTTVPGHLARAGPVLRHLVRAGSVSEYFARAGHSFANSARAGSLPGHFGQAGCVGALLSACPVVGHLARPLGYLERAVSLPARPAKPGTA